MKGLLHVFSVVAVIGLAFWAYQENYRTQTALRDVRNLHAEIGAAHARLNMLQAEWAYLNRPDRLRDLADLNFDRLGLLPLMPEAFGKVDQIVMPPPALGAILNSIAISSDYLDPNEEPL